MSLGERLRLLFVVLGALLLIATACTGQSGRPNQAAIDRGSVLVRELGCGGCHSTDATNGLGPGWGGLWGTKRELTDGRTVLVDTEYLRRSIVDPRADVVAGFDPTMPLFPLSNEEIDDLTAYLKYISGGEP